MKKILIITLCMCLALSSVIGVYAAETETAERPRMSRGEMPQFNGERPQFNGERPQFNPEDMPQFDPANMPQRGQFSPDNMPQNMPQGEMNRDNAPEKPQATAPVSESTPEPKEDEQQPLVEGEEMPGSRQFGGMGNPRQNTAPADSQQTTGFWGFLKAYSTPVTAVVLLGLAFVFVVFYRRKNY